MLWPIHYTADQADVYLGMNAGARLYGDSRYAQAAGALRAQVPRMFALASSALGMPFPSASLDWIAAITLDPSDGSVRDTKSRRSEKFSNVAGFTTIAFLGFPSNPQ